jgi:GNAT superfamily N-acetyltransferase
MGETSKPELITKQHLLDNFCSGKEVLDDRLQKRALKNHHEGASKTFVIHEHNRVVAYYCIATGSIESNKAPGKIRRNMPDPIPVIVLGRLAVYKDYQELGLGKGLLKDAALRTLTVTREIGVRALLVHALSKSAHLLPDHSNRA